jgi:hypothetical protein
MSVSNHWLERKKERVVNTKDKIVLSIGNKDMIEISSNGFYVEGRFVTKDEDVYDAFVSFLAEYQKVKS